MKKTRLIFALAFLISCYSDSEETPHSQIEQEIEIDVDITSVYDAVWYVAFNVNYVSDYVNHKTFEYWQTPAETLATMTGDCEDMALLAMWLINKFLSKHSFLILATAGNTTSGHAFMFADGYFIDIYSCSFSTDFNFKINGIPYLIQEVIPYHTAMYMAQFER